MKTILAACAVLTSSTILASVVKPTARQLEWADCEIGVIFRNCCQKSRVRLPVGL